MKRLIAIIMSVLLIALMAGCAAGNTEDTVYNVMALNGPTGVSMSYLASQNLSGSDADYNITFASAPDEISGKLITKECDFACVPTNLASVLFNKTEGQITVCAVTTLGVLYLVDTSGEVNELSDLEGMTIGATGQGSNPEYILNYILSENGLSDSVTVNYYADHSELATLILAGEVTTAMLPEPFVTQVLLKSDAEVNTINLQAEWTALTGGVELAQGVIVVRTEILENDPEAVEKFLADFEASSDYATENVSDTALLCADLGIIASATIAEQAIPRCNITYIDGEDMKTSVNAFLNVLYQANPASIGGAMPTDSFYYVG